jgi:hypothetical protein
MANKIAPKEWYNKYGRKIEKIRLPKKEEQKLKYAANVGEDGFYLLDNLKKDRVPESILNSSKVKALNRMNLLHQ